MDFATPEGWEWQCAGCHRPVAPMGMCETCGVFGIMRATEYPPDSTTPQSRCPGCGSRSCDFDCPD